MLIIGILIIFLNVYSSPPNKTIVSPSIRMTESEMRSKREAVRDIVDSLQQSKQEDTTQLPGTTTTQQRQKIIGILNVSLF